VGIILFKTKFPLVVLLVVYVFGLPHLNGQDNRQLQRDSLRASTSERRTALVIGNAGYVNAPTLRNPSNDASDMARTLKSLGFEVTSGINLNQRDMKRLIREFGQKLRAGGSGLFYYAGHGVQSKGHNYLIPIEADIQSETDVEDQGVDVGLVLGLMDEANNGLNVVILDACRNNPFARSFRSVNNGLAQVDAPTGTLIAYSTAPGKVARDGEGRNGAYTAELLKQMQVPGLTIEELLKRVRANLKQLTNGEQVPWETSSLVGNFYFNLPNNLIQGADVNPGVAQNNLRRFEAATARTDSQPNNIDTTGHHSADVGNFLFTIDACSRSQDRVICEPTVTNNSDEDREIFISVAGRDDEDLGRMTRAFDQRGSEYIPRDLHFGSVRKSFGADFGVCCSEFANPGAACSFGGCKLTNTLVPQIAMKIRLEFVDIDHKIDLIALLRIYIAWTGPKGEKLSADLRNVPIIRNDNNLQLLRFDGLYYTRKPQRLAYMRLYSDGTFVGVGEPGFAIDEHTLSKKRDLPQGTYEVNGDRVTFTYLKFTTLTKHHGLIRKEGMHIAYSDGTAGDYLFATWDEFRGMDVQKTPL
jgi:Caspase domain